MNRLRIPVLAGVLCAATAIATAQSEESPPTPLGPPKVSIVLGVGNATGGLGLGAELHLGQGRASVFAGLGHLPESMEDGREFASGTAGAFGVRLYAGRVRGRLFAELSISAVAQGSTWSLEPEGDVLYGPGLQAGYQLIQPKGFTFAISLGVGHAFDGGPGSTQPMAQLSFGWTRRGPAEPVAVEPPTTTARQDEHMGPVPGPSARASSVRAFGRRR